MRSRRFRWVVGLAMFGVLGALQQLNCVSFGGQEFMRTIDFCFLFDCQNGALGGLLDPCPSTATTTDSSSSTTTVYQPNLFVDCPVTTTTN
jgi:hypothetical protein